MAWIYLVESEALASHCENGLNPLPIAKSTHIVKECCSHEWPMNHFATVLSGMTLRHWMEIYSKEQLTSFTEGFPARILALREMEQAWQESAADYFSRSCAWPKKFSPNSYSLKMCPQSQAEGEFKSLMKLPRWGMIVDGVLYPLHPLELYTDAKGGFCWPTPTARDWKDSGREPSAQKRKSPSLPAAVKIYATPTASQANKPIRKPKPSCLDGNHGEDLQDSVGRMYPSTIGKKLCPLWVSVLMGYPILWTELEPWVMPWFLSKRKKRSKY